MTGGARPRRRPRRPRGLAALGLADPPAAPVRVAPAARGALAIRRVDTAVPGVVFYRAMRTAPPVE